MPTKSPWLTKDSYSDPSWNDHNETGYVWEKYSGRVKSLFDIPKDATQIRFVLSTFDEDYGYLITSFSTYQVYIQLSNGKGYKWDEVLLGLTEFIRDNRGVGKYLSLEYR